MNITANSLSIEQTVRTIFTIVLVEVISNISKNNTIIMVYAVGISATIGDIVSLIYIYANYLKSRREIWIDIITSKTSINGYPKKNFIFLFLCLNIYIPSIPPIEPPNNANIIKTFSVCYIIYN